MHALELAEFAATFAGWSSNMLALKCAPGRRAGQRYWLEARYRHDYWTSKLAAHRQDLQYLSVANRKRSWLRIIPIIEEVLIAEPLARCVAYHGRLLSEREIDNDLLALSQSVLSSHIEARHRCLHLIVFGDGLAIEHSKRLNQLRRTMERYNDALLALLEPIGPPDTFSFEPLAVRRTQEIWQSVAGGEVDFRRLHFASLHHAIGLALDRKISDQSPSLQSNAKLHHAAVEFLPPSSFDSFGVPWSSKVASMTSESPESMASVEVLSQATAASIGFLFQPNRPTSRAASAEGRRW